jgi:hypothetical protein
MTAAVLVAITVALAVGVTTDDGFLDSSQFGFYAAIAPYRWTENLREFCQCGAIAVSNALVIAQFRPHRAARPGKLVLRAGVETHSLKTSEISL